MALLEPTIRTHAGHPYQSLDTFLNSMGPSPFYFSIDNSLGGEFVSPNGFIYQFPASVFTDAWHQPIAGKVRLRSMEIINKRSLFYAGYSAFSDRCLLNMEYCIDLQIVEEAYSGIQLAGTYRVSLPSGKNIRWSEQEIYQKRSAKVNLLKGEARRIWAASNLSLLLHKKESGKRASFFSSSTGAFMIGSKLKKTKRAKQRSMISVVPDQVAAQLTDLRAYLVFHESNTVIQLDKQRGSFAAFHLPKGKKASLLLMGMEKGRFYFHRLFIGSISNQRLECHLQAINNYELQAELQRMIF